MNKLDLIRAYLAGELRARRLQSGGRLPGCRQLAASLGVNKLTVNKAYRVFESEQLVYSVPRGGFYIVDTEGWEDAAGESAAGAGPSPEAGARAGVGAGAWDSAAAAASRAPLDCRSLVPEARLVPFKEFTHVMNRAVEQFRSRLFGYEQAAGFPGLLETLQADLARDDIYAHPTQLVVTNGAQQALWLVLQVLFSGAARKLLVEAPTYSLLLEAADQLRIPVVGIARGPDGLDFRLLSQLFRSGEYAAFYVIPRHHNPTGYSLTEGAKKRLAALAADSSVVLIEDDYLAGLGSGKGELPLHYHDRSKATIHIRSFSKTFMPGIRTGLAIVPEALVEPVLHLKRLHDLNTSSLPQAALGLFIGSGLYRRHLARISQAYDRKLALAREIFAALAPEGLHWHIPQHGLFVWLELPPGLSAVAAEKALEAGGILVKAADAFFPARTVPEPLAFRHRGLRVCLCGIPAERLPELARLLRLLGGMIAGQGQS
ncbi:MAG: hypothetical protein A2Y37_05220 [Spirochaetes bacterium GWB1_60_80]|nr:MAG: hypothetical protein A2Y37_05220 [Spirochaetes bacterium GWB1_60_80]OHD60260.1 MAG: hypothetical protein A2Y32_07460 [Spirochaetes bacterium GWF1_60_12]HAX37585.1 PLP-dependent aminotransferase family protein [Spirochaetaceae bacterium]HBO40995.1 PLP-dependent aminotransferase family protein [Spirochaetaceae bacterium]